MPRFLFILNRLPHQGLALAELLDVLFTTAAFEQSVSLLFVDAGVLQLYSTQQPGSYGLKDTLAMFSALELYGVTEYYVEQESLHEYGLQLTDLQLKAMPIARSAVSELLQQFTHIY